MATHMVPASDRRHSGWSRLGRRPCGLEELASFALAEFGERRLALLHGSGKSSVSVDLVGVFVDVVVRTTCIRASFAGWDVLSISHGSLLQRRKNRSSNPPVAASGVTF